jgi:Domain of unknown function (DUF397)
MSAPDFSRARWTKSSFSEAERQCVELAAVDGWVGVRDSKLAAASPVLTVTPAAFHAFLTSVKNHQLGH